MSKHESIRFRSKFLPPVPLTVASSGGVDSLCGAFFLAQNRQRDITLFHFNHNLREQNHRMEKAVRRFARAFAFKLIVCDTKDFSLGESTSLEAACRTARLNAMIATTKGPMVMCHHLDDCIESYLMRCFEGTFENNYWNVIPPFTSLPEPILMRPFLMTTKGSFRQYAKKKGIESYIEEDESNYEPIARRNIVRNKLLPIIEPTWPGIRKVVRRMVAEDYQKAHAIRSNDKDGEANFQPIAAS